MTADLCPIPFFSWLCRVQAALAEEQPAEVPCGGCNACCRTSHVVHVRPDERRTRARIPRRFLLPAPGLPPGNLVLGYDRAGCCPMLIGGHCSIYEDRPLACRTYDCRIYAAAGIVADRAAIARRVDSWRFTYPSQNDRDRHAAVKAAASYIGQHAECLATAAARRDPLRVAVLAIAVHEAFLPDATGASDRASFADATARAVMAANEELFGDW
jgi:hypothetical protein